ncbi:MAG: Crp/Fnr family transcriptional regulator [Myxococcota bacterium]
MTDKEVLGALMRRYPAGAILFEENDPGSRMFVIRTGRVRIYRRTGEHEMVLATLGPGDFFGEMALLESLPRSANAQAIEAVELIEVDGETFEQMILSNTEIAVRMMRKLASRVRELDTRLQNLLMDGGVGRAIEVLRWLAPRGKREGAYVRLDASTVHIGISAEAGISSTEVHTVLERLRAAGCVRDEGGDVLIGNSEMLDDFSTYLDLKRKYEASHAPTPNKVDDDEKRSLQRLLKALQINPKEMEKNQQALSSQYKKFLDLRRRFEPSRGPVR